METFQTVSVDVKSDLLDKLFRLRVVAWATEVPGFEKEIKWQDEWDSIAKHWAVLKEGDPIAAARLSVHKELKDVPHFESYQELPENTFPSPIASFNRLVVHPQWRGKGLGALLDETRLCEAELLGCRCAIGICDSGPHRIKQLLKAGFSVVGHANLYFECGPARTNHDMAILRCLLPR